MDAKDLQWDLRISSLKLVKKNIRSVLFFFISNCGGWLRTATSMILPPMEVVLFSKHSSPLSHNDYSPQYHSHDRYGLYRGWLPALSDLTE